MPDERVIEAVTSTMVARAKPRTMYGSPRSIDQSQPETGPVYVEVGSSSRSSGCCGRSETELATRLVSLVECVSRVVKLKRKGTKENLTVLLFCEDGYVSSCSWNCDTTDTILTDGL
jgi:hypothetical protein